MVLLGAAGSSAGCNDAVTNLGPGSAVFSSRVPLSAEQGGGTASGGAFGLGGSLGGAGGAGDVAGFGGASLGGAPPEEGEFAHACTPGVYFEDDLPECFVAEISTASVPCKGQGREKLSEVREARARQDECDFRGLGSAACEALHVCGIQAFQPPAPEPCGVDGPAAGAGFCVGAALSDCSAAAEQTVRVFGVSEQAEALQIYCAVEDRL